MGLFSDGIFEGFLVAYTSHSEEGPEEGFLSNVFLSHLTEGWEATKAPEDKKDDSTMKDEAFEHSLDVLVAKSVPKLPIRVRRTLMFSLSLEETSNVNYFSLNVMKTNGKKHILL